MKKEILELATCLQRNFRKIFDAEFLLPNAGDIDENDFLLIVGRTQVVSKVPI